MPGNINNVQLDISYNIYYNTVMNLIKRVLGILVIVLICVFSGLSLHENALAASTTISLKPTADSYVNSSLPSTNYGTSSSLNVIKSPTDVTYFKFDLSSLSAKVITKAQLSLSITNASINSEQIYQVTDTSWTETGITYSKQPVVGSQIVKTFTASKTGTVTIDLTSFVSGNAGKIVSLAIKSNGNDTLTIRSKEASSNQPVLAITYTIPTPTPTSKPSVTPTRTPTPTNKPTLTPTMTPAPTKPITPTPTNKPSPTPTSTPLPTTTPMPSVTSVPTPTPTITPIPGSHVIYDDNLSSGWQSWSWDSNINFANSSPVYAGSQSINYTATAAYSGLDLHNPTGIDTSSYTMLHFALQAGQGNSDYAIYVEDNTGKAITTPIDLGSLGGQPTQGSWTVYNIPLSSLSADNKTITGIVLHDISGSATSVLYVDSVSLTSQTVETPVITDNVPNNSLEQTSSLNGQPLGWHTNSWGTNTPVFTYLSTGHTGTKSVETQVTSYTSGDAKWYYDSQPVTPMQKYYFKDYYESNTTSRIVIEFTSSDGTQSYSELNPAQAETNWTQYVASFTAPASAQTMTVMHLLSSVGFLITDDYQVVNYVPEGFNQGLVSITWDDGIESQYSGAFPIMQKYNLPGTFYLVSGFLNTDFFMTATQAAELQSAGDELAAHTLDHPDLTTVTPDQLQIELGQSQKDLQTIFGTSFNDFATPYGAYNDQVMAVIKEYYRSHRGVETGYNSKDNFNIYDILVQDVNTSTTPSQVTAWVEQAKQDKTWLVLVYHQVDNPTDPYSISGSDLDAELQTIKNSGMPVLTVDRALSQILPQVSR